MQSQRIILPGGAGLVGQNLVLRLKARGYTNLLVIDKHQVNLETLAKLHPDVQTVLADMSVPGGWQVHFHIADVVILLQAQIGGNECAAFERNNIESTRLILASIRTAKTPYLVHVSSSVVDSVADDFYSITKRAQEKLVVESGLQFVILRPTLMFGWFDRKHLGWLSRFMRKIPIFPIPGSGRYTRQPLYVGDFCEIIISCLENRRGGGVYNISGQQSMSYIDIIRAIRKTTGSTTILVHIPYGMFRFLLWVWSVFDKNPPFTTQQLEALCANDEFEVIDWPSIFGVLPTPFEMAISETFGNSCYSNIVLEF
jgi:nucleoside-diphosphate-sugar epimerase